MAQSFWSISICLCMDDFRLYFNMISTSSNVLKILAYRYRSDFDVRIIIIIIIMSLFREDYIFS